jgi:gliding motility-associated-like protein/uncharacterized repeat protein (TIGR01451 family)
MTLAGPFTVEDDKIANITAVNGPLVPGASVTATASYTITQTDLNAGSVTNVATATGNGVTSNEATETVTATQTQSIGIVKTSDLNSEGDENCVEVVAGETVITYTFTVTNEGNVSLSGVEVSDELEGLSDLSAAVKTGGNQDDLLDVNETWTYTATYTVQQSDLEAGQIDNTVEVSTDNETVSDEDTLTIELCQTPAIEILKDGVFVDGNADGFAQVGETIRYTFTVTNTGNVTLSNVRVQDEKVAVQGGPLATLAVGASNSTTFTATYVLTQSDIDKGLVSNIALARGEKPGGNPEDPSDDVTDTSSDPTPVNPAITDPTCVGDCTITEIARNSGIQIVKTDNATVVSKAGDIISYTLTATNIGNVTLVDVIVTDPLTGLTQMVGTLAPTASIAVNTSYTVTQADVDRGSVLNTAFVTGNSPDGKVPTDGDEVTTPIRPNPSITLEKVADKTQIAIIGEVIVYTLTVTNTGNVILSNVTVTDPMTGFSGNVGVMLPGEVKVLTTSYTVTSSDLTNATLVNVATAKGDLPGQGTVKDDASATVTIAANMIIANDDAFGTHFISFGGVLGNILENDILNGVVSPNPSLVDFEFTELDGVIGLLINDNGELSLIPGVNEARDYRLKYTLRETVNPNNSDDAFVVFRLLNDQVDLSVSKTSFTAQVFEGDEFEYEIRLSNIGGTPASNVILVDDLPNGVTYLSSRVESVSSTQIQVGTPLVTGTRITWNIPFLPANGVVVIRLRVQAGDAGTITNVANVSAAEDDTDLLNNQGNDVNQILPFRIPNVITPNQDGDNDTFEIKGLDKFVSNEIVIINRYGDHVFERKDYQNDWDAPGQVAGTYFYILTTVDKAGKNHVYKGWIQVIKD